MYRISKLFEPTTIDEALVHLMDNPTAKVIAGGTDLLLAFRQRKYLDIPLVSLRRIQELSWIQELPDGSLQIGAMVTFSQLNADKLVRKRFPFLAEAAKTMGGPQIRNMATIGGNLCNGATSADSAPPLLALDALLTVVGPKGMREVALRDFYKGLYQVDLQPNEILVAITVPNIPEPWGGCYTKFSIRKAMDIATLGCAVVCLKDNDTTIKSARIALGTAAPVPIRCSQAEQAVAGKEISPELLTAAGTAALADANPRSSWRASKEYRQELIVELVAGTLQQAFSAAEVGTDG